jgi:uncharacterized protein
MQSSNPARFGGESRPVTNDPLRRGSSANGMARAGFWQRQFRQWHWISSALCLALVMMFAVTGITLNHAGMFEAAGKSVVTETDLPAALVAELATVKEGDELPARHAAAIRKLTGAELGGQTVRPEYGELNFDLARPGRDASLLIDLNEGRAYYEEIDRGTVAMLNDLHKGRNAGPAWSLLIDLTAACFIVFALTGFGLLWLQARRQPSTWPITSFGVMLPVIAYLLLVHISETLPCATAAP